MPNIEVTATGNVQGAVSGLEALNTVLGKTDKQSSTTEKAILSLSSAIAKVPAPFANTTVGVRAFETSLGKVTPQLQKLGTGANQATGAMINLGRIVQDAPFGFLGIANNINPLLESFQRLKVETGSTGGALKALTGSLLGGGGLGLAVSVVSGLMSYFALNSMKKTTDEGIKNEKVITRLKDTYQLFTEEVEKLAAAAAQEAVKVSVLFGALGDSNIKLDERKVIIKQLNELSPAYLGNLNAEKSSYEQISAAVSSYVDDLGKAAFIKSFLPEFETIFKKLIETQVELRKLNLSQKGIFGLSEEDYAAEKKRLETQIRLFKQDIGSAKKFLEREAGGANNLSEILFGKNPKEVKIKVPKIKIELDKRSGLLPQSDIQELQKLTVRPEVTIVPNIKSVIVDPEQEKKVFDGIQALFDAAKLRKFQEEASAAISETIKNIQLDAISGAADAIGTALATGGDPLPDLFGALIKSLGSQIQELGKYLVKAGVEMLIAKKALDALNITPQTAIIAGFALQILGATLKASFNKKKLNFATGVRDFQGGGIVTVGERGPENIFLPTHSRVQPNNEVNAYGGGNMVFIPAVTLSGSDLVIAFNRASQQMGRNN